MQHITDRLADDELCTAVCPCFALVDEDEMLSLKIVDQPRRRVDDERGAADDERVRRADRCDGALDRCGIETFLIEHDVGTDVAAAGAAGNGRVLHDVVERVVRAAVRAVCASDRAVQLVDRPRACRLMEAVDVLCYNRCEMSAPLELREGVVPRVRRRIEIDEAPPIEVEELSRVRHEKAVRRHLLRTELLM